MKVPLSPVARVELSRYMGDWFVIANIPYFAEKDCVDSVESYSLRADGKIDNWFTCRKKSFDAPMKRRATAVAVVDDPASNAVWSVRFWKLLSVKYYVLDLDPAYGWAVIGHPSRKYAWILARNRTLDDAIYQHALQSLATQGYDVTRLRKVPQSASTQ